MTAVYRREIRGCLTTMTGAVSAAVMLLLAGLMFRYYNLQSGLLTYHYALSGSTLIFYIVIPVLTMRVFSEERSKKTDRMLFSYPVRVTEIVAGKYLALVTVFAVPVLFMAANPLIMRAFGRETLVWDYSCLFAFFLMGCAYLAVGMFFSSCTENAVVAAILATFFVFLTQMLGAVIPSVSASGTVSLLFLYALSLLAGVLVFSFTRNLPVSLSAVLLLVLLFTGTYFAVPAWYSGRTGSILRVLDFEAHFTEFSGGVFSLSGIVYFVSYIAAGLFFTWVRFAAGKDEKFSSGVYFLLLSAVFLGILSAANLVVSVLPKRYTAFDVTDAGLYSIGESTANLLDSLDRDVTLYILTSPGREDEAVEHLAASYAARSPHVHTESVDVVRNPAFVRQYTDASVSLGSVLAVAGERAEAADYSLFYQLDSQTGQAAAFDAEGQITAAIGRLLADRKVKICLLTGHGEMDPGTLMLDAFSKASVETESVNLLSEEIPDDCAAVILFAPTADLTELEGKRLRYYLGEGGRALIVTMPRAVTGTETPILDSVLSAYGIMRLPGLVMEENASHFAGAPYLILPEVCASQLTGGLSGQNLLYALPEAISLTSDSDEIVFSALPVLKTSGGAYLKNSIDKTVERESGDAAGEFTLAACIEETPSVDSMGDPDVPAADEEEADGEAERKITKLVYFTSPCIFSPDALSTLIQENSALPEANETLFAQTVSYLTEEEHVSAVPPKALVIPQTVLPSSAPLILGNILMLALPALILLAGAYVFVRRRRR
ncbi:MAG: Gldg family protein [Lachnospiraceae bacterium]|nr:Gldg family protein [Lachnospiraceae bacterium]